MKKYRYYFITILLLSLFIAQNVYADISQDTIKLVQNTLNNLGYDCGTPDGIAGSKTSSAIQNYQTDKGLSVTGNITDELLNSLGIVDVDIPGVLMNTFIDRYNAAINEYNLIADRDGYSKANTLDQIYIKTGTKEYKLDNNGFSLTLNDGSGNSANMVGSFRARVLLDKYYDKEILTGELASCIYAFDESLSSFHEALDLYAQVMETNTDFIREGDILYMNSSITGCVDISGKFDGFEEAISQYQESLIASANSGIESLSENIETTDEFEVMLSAIGQPNDAALKVIPYLNDSSYKSNSRTYDYSTDGSILNNSGRWRFDINDNNELTAIYFLFQNTLSEEEGMDISRTLFGSDYYKTSSNSYVRYYYWPAPENKQYYFLYHYNPSNGEPPSGEIGICNW